MIGMAHSPKKRSPVSATLLLAMTERGKTAKEKNGSERHPLFQNLQIPFSHAIFITRHFQKNTGCLRSSTPDNEIRENRSEKGGSMLTQMNFPIRILRREGILRLSPLLLPPFSSAGAERGTAKQTAGWNRFHFIQYQPSKDYSA